ncbi:MAG TPA: hypothetical protein H9729_07525, partial [Candidatus Borkfalkia excrementigallinarum]|nr:hypothetical protein [Candidatus Borkfalkia excrementigallinarum]
RTQFVAYLRPPRVKLRDSTICVPLIIAQRGQSPQNRRHQLAEIFASRIITRASRITFLRQRTQFADTSAHGRGESDAHIYSVLLKGASLRGKPLWFPLKIVEICFVIAKGDCGALVFAFASK